jgi:hypothetical protein
MRCLEIEAFLELNPNDYDQEKPSPATEDYNCIAWAAGHEDHPWWPSKEFPYYYHWPDGLDRQEAGKETLANFIKAFETEGYEKCDDGSLENGIEKVALFEGPSENPLHAARQLESGRWTSKCGDYQDIDHVSLSVVEGKAYGKAKVFLKRRRLVTR